MAKRVKQFRFYKQGDTKNYPATVSMADLVSGRVFRDCVPITDLGIQGLPGTKFYLNGSVDPVIIGHSGIYQLNLNGSVRISGLSFDARSIQSIADNSQGYLIVDIVYEGV